MIKISNPREAAPQHEQRGTMLTKAKRKLSAFMRLSEGLTQNHGRSDNLETVPLRNGTSNLAGGETVRRNNPRAFAEAISIDVWRTPYQGEKCEADLHIDVGFFEGRLGGDTLSSSPVTFRLTLRRAEIHVIRDQGRIIAIPPSSVIRAETINSKAVTKSKQEAEFKGSAGLNLKDRPRFELDAAAKSSLQVTKEVHKEEDLSPMRVSHRKAQDDSGYVFVIEPVGSKVLSGQPWNANEPRLALRDTKSKRKRGVAPEVTVQVRCKREDLVIEDVRFKDEAQTLLDHFSRNKMLAVEQYLKKEILEMGLQCGDLSEPFAGLVLGDAVSVEF